MRAPEKCANENFASIGIPIIWNIVTESVAIVKSREDHCTDQSAAGIDSLELESKYLHSPLKFSSYQFIFHFMF